uniref:Uncharacterized protein n=1 Tax=Helianthus annuus TaxID=4232 RepID=A0A251T6I5_HELAN
MWCTVETVSPLFGQRHRVFLSTSIQIIVFTHRNLGSIHASRNLVFIENNVVWEPTVVLEDNLLASGDTEGGRLKCQSTVIVPQQDVKCQRFRASSRHLNVCGGCVGPCGNGLQAGE